VSNRKRQNLLIGISAGLGTVLILAAAWQFSKGQRFNSFSDEAGQYSIKYPYTWALQKTPGDASVMFFSEQEGELDIFRENVSVVVQDLSGNPQDLNDYSEMAVKQMEAVFKDNLTILDSSPVRFAKRQGYKFEFIGKGPETEFHYLIYWTISGVTAYQVTYTALASQYERYLYKVKKMIKSFRIR